MPASTGNTGDTVDPLGGDRHPTPGPPPRPPARPPPGLSPRLSLVLPAEAASLGVARSRLGAWLAGHGWPEAQRADLVLAASEALTNSIEHGYGAGPYTARQQAVVRLDAAITTSPDGYRRAEITVRDHGTWRPPPTDSLHRGRGLPMMRGCTDDLTIDGTSSGTTVTLISPAAPPRNT